MRLNGGSKFIVLLLSCAFLAGALSGCAFSDNSEDIEVVGVWREEDQLDDDSEGGSGEDAYTGIENKKIGMVTDVGGIDDQSFNQSAWEGLQELSRKTGVKTTYVETLVDTEHAANLQKIVDDNCTLCWGIGYASADALYEKAIANPEVNFAIIDSSFEDTPSNVTGVVFRAEEPSFLVGYIAAAVTKTGKIGFVGGMKSDIIDQFEYGYRAGVDYACGVYGKEVEVDIEYADSYTDVDKGREIGKRMYKEGCDIVYHAAGGVGIGVIEEAVKADEFVIGVDRDQSYLAPENVLTSAMKLVNVAVERVSKAYLKDEDIGGKTLSFGLNEGAVGIPDEHDNYRDEIYDAALVIEDRIKSGDIDPPANEKEYMEFKEKNSVN